MVVRNCRPPPRRDLGRRRGWQARTHATTAMTCDFRKRRAHVQSGRPWQSLAGEPPSVAWSSSTRRLPSSRRFSSNFHPLASSSSRRLRISRRRMLSSRVAHPLRRPTSAGSQRPRPCNMNSPLRRHLRSVCRIPRPCTAAGRFQTLGRRHPTHILHRRRLQPPTFRTHKLARRRCNRRSRHRTHRPHTCSHLSDHQREMPHRCGGSSRHSRHSSSTLRRTGHRRCPLQLPPS